MDKNSKLAFCVIAGVLIGQGYEIKKLIDRQVTLRDILKEIGEYVDKKTYDEKFAGIINNLDL